MGASNPDPPAARHRLSVRHLFPLATLLLLGLAVSGPVIDNGFLWHIRAGTVQLEAGRVLTADPFSYSMGGTAWRTQSWLAELGYGSLERWIGGVGWVGPMVLVLGLAMLGFVGLAVYAANRSAIATAGWLVLVIWLAAPLQPRPVVFSHLLLAVFVVIIAREKQVAWMTVPLLWIWASLHGSWVIGVALLVLSAIRLRSRRLGVATAFGLLAATLTAHGIGVWEIVIDFARNRDALDLMTEWGPPAFGEISQGPFLVVLGVIIVAAVRGRIQPRDLWVILPFVALGLTTQRTVFPATIVLVPFAARAFTVRLPVQSEGSRWLVRTLAVVAVIAMFVPLLGRGSGIDPTQFPSDDALAAVGSDRFFHDDQVGGYLIYRDYPETLVYLDDRAELYGVERLDEFVDARSRGRYEELFARYGMTAAIVRPDWALTAVLEKDGWVEVARDDGFIVLRRP